MMFELVTIDPNYYLGVLIEVVVKYRLVFLEKARFLPPCLPIKSHLQVLGIDHFFQDLYKLKISED